MGVAPGWGGAKRLVSNLGQRKALELLLTCKKLDAEKGLADGYFDAVISSEDALHEAESWILGK